MSRTGETNLDRLVQDQGEDEEGEEEEEDLSTSSESDFGAGFSKLRMSSSSVVGSPSWSHFLARPSTPRGVGERPFAWQSTAKTYTRAALVPSGLVDDVLVVSAEPFWVSEEELQAGETSMLRREPAVLERLPPASKAGRGCLTDGSMTREERIEGGGRPEPPQRVEWFCFPSGFVEAQWREERPATRSHVFALFADGSPLRGVVLMSYRAAEFVEHGWRAPKEDQEPALLPPARKLVWVPVAICLLTRLAIVPALCAWVEQLAVALDDADASVSADARREALEVIFSCAAQLADEVPRPVAGVLSLKVAGPAKEMVHVREHFAASRGNQVRRASALDRRLMGRPTGGGGSLWLAALLLGPEGLVKALACALLEKSVLLIAQDAALLAPVAEALLALVRPFEWSHVYVPVLPRPLLELLDAPQPFLLGVLSSWLPDDFFSVVATKNEDDTSHENDAKKKSQPAASANKMSRRSSAKKTPGMRNEPTARQPPRRRPSNRAAASAAFWQATPIAPGTIAFDLDAGTCFAPSPSTSGPALSSDHDALPEDFADAVRAATRTLQLAAIEAIDQDAASRQSGAMPTVKRAARLSPASETLLAAETALQAACSNQMRRLLDGCANFLERDDTPAPDDRARLRADEFVGAHPVPYYRPFLRRLCETQHFWQFVDLTREQLLRGGDSAATPPSPASSHSRDEYDDALCYNVPPPLPQQPLPDKPSESGSSGGASKSATSSSKKRRRSYRRSVPYEERSFQVTHEWQLDAFFGTDRPPANTRVYRYGLLADLLCVPFDDLWRQLEGDNGNWAASTRMNHAV